MSTYRVFVLWRKARFARERILEDLAHEFTVLVRDDRPDIAAKREGEYCAGENKRIRDVKKRYREWTGGRWRIHASATARETADQYRFLTGRDLDGLKMV